MVNATNVRRIVEIWEAGWGVLLERRYDGFAIIRAGRKVAHAIEFGPDR